MRLGLSRSEFYQRALVKYLEFRSSPDVTAKLNQVYSSGEKSHINPVLDELHRATFNRGNW